MTTNDNKLPLIREVIHKYLPGARVILFGSRATGKYDNLSDYDVMAVFHGNLTLEEIKIIKPKIRRDLAEIFIPVDIIVTTDNDIQRINCLTNHIIKEALTNGVTI